MQQILHRFSTAPETVRRAIQTCQDSVIFAAKCYYGFSPTKVQKWRSQGCQPGLPIGGRHSSRRGRFELIVTVVALRTTSFVPPTGRRIGVLSHSNFAIFGITERVHYVASSTMGDVTNQQLDDASTRNLTWNELQPREQRWRNLGQRPVIAWFTGLSGSGKSTIANAVDCSLLRTGRHTMVLDGDNLRHGMSSDLGFTAVDRVENIRRAAETARLMAEAGLVVIVSLISPSRQERGMARRIAGDIPFLEVFIDTSLPICEARDPKGLYRRARAGEVPNFTGISAPYEAPEAPNIIVPTEGCTVEQSASYLIPDLMSISATDTSQAV